MPTPFTHLHFANQILSELPTREVLHARRGDFFLGSVAPDLSTLNGLRRDETHFFMLPPRPNQCGPLDFLRRYPQFRAAAHLPTAAAAFISGYLAHLLADEIWLWRIFVPYFVRDLTAADARRKLTIHNAIRAYVDRHDRAALSEDTRADLLHSRAADLLPFAPAGVLADWRQMLCEQLLPGAALQTMEVFARQVGVTPQTLENCLNEELAHPDEIFRAIVPDILTAYQREVMRASVDLVARYLSGALAHIEPNNGDYMPYYYDAAQIDWAQLTRNWRFVYAAGRTDARTTQR